MSTKKFNWKKLIPLVILVLALILLYVFDLYRYLSFSELQKHHDAILAWTDQHYLLAVLLFMLFYFISTAISFPGGTILTMSGGFLFGIVLGTLYVVIAASIGAVVIFLAARYAFADLLKSKAGPWMKKLDRGFENDAFNYLLFLRLLPLFPFWLINIVPGLLNMRLAPYFIATLIGIIPGSAVYVSVGSGLSNIFKQGETPDFGIIFKPEIFLPFIALAILALIPIVYKRIQQRRNKS